MAKHAPRFLDIVNDAKQRIQELTVEQIKSQIDAGEDCHLVDVREESEFAAGRLPNAIHIGKGVLERDIERIIPDIDVRIILYCGGGFRSALAADSLIKMGYRNVFSMDGGFSGWREANYPILNNDG